MEDLAPPLSVVLQIVLAMENGHSFRESMRQMLTQTTRSRFHECLKEWVVRKSHNQSSHNLIRSEKSIYRRALLDLFERGWDGEPILEPLQSLRIEIQGAANAELDYFVATLPFRVMLPLLLLQFPAYLLLLLGPLMTDLFRLMKQSLVVLSLLSHLLAAHSANDVAKVKAQYEDILQSQRICKVQSSQDVVPDACFRALARGKIWGLYTDEQYKELEKKWERQCERVARAGIFSRDNRLQVRLDDLSPPCRATVQRARDIQSYRFSDY
jgi:hypothetical protein